VTVLFIVDVMEAGTWFRSAVGSSFLTSGCSGEVLCTVCVRPYRTISVFVGQIDQDRWHKVCLIEASVSDLIVRTRSLQNRKF
jgi:hypothetical protein